MKRYLIALLPMLFFYSCLEEDPLPVVAALPTVTVGDVFLIGEEDAQVLDIRDDFWCTCCLTCNCASSPSVTLLVNTDTLTLFDADLSGFFFGSTFDYQPTATYNGFTLTARNYQLGTCEDRREPDEFEVDITVE